MSDQIKAQDTIEILLAQIAAESYIDNDNFSFEQRHVQRAHTSQFTLSQGKLSVGCEITLPFGKVLLAN
jgi:hypothetical protein